MSATPILSLAARADTRGGRAADAALIRFLCISLPLLLVLVSWADPQLDKSLFLTLNRQASLLPDGFWATLSVLGGTSYLCALALPWVLRHPRHMATLLLLILVVGVSVALLKDIVSTPRPSWVLESGSFHLIGPTYRHFSFPSGRAAGVFAIALLIVDRLEYRLLPSLLALACALAVAGSQVAVGAHWPIDVAGGALVGSLAGCAFLALTRSDPFFAHRAWRAAALITLLVVVAALARSPEVYAGISVVRWLLIGLLAYGAYRSFRRAPDESTILRRVRDLLAYPDPALLRFVRFGLIGLSGFCVDLSVYTMLLAKFGLLPASARLYAYVAAATSNWFFNRTFTFQDRRRTPYFVQWNLYLLMCAVSFVPNFGAFWILIHTSPMFAAHTQLGLAAGVLCGMLFNFAIASRWIFPREPVEA